MMCLFVKSARGFLPLFGFLCLVLFSYRPSFGEEMVWDVKSKQDDITIFQRQGKDSSLQEIRGRIRIDAPMAALLSVLSDGEQWTAWMPRTVRAKIIKKNTRGFLFYTQFKGFGPVWNREVYLLMSAHCQMALENGMKQRQVEIRFTTEGWDMSNLPGEEEHVIRMPKMVGHWRLWPAELPTKTYVEYQAYLDAGGQLISSIKNMAARTLVKRALRNLQKQVTKFPVPDLVRMEKDAPSLFPECLSKASLQATPSNDSTSDVDKVVLP